MTIRPLLFIDVDGVLNPLGPGARPEGFCRYELLGYEVWLSTLHGRWLNDLRRWFDLAWATTWEQDAPRLVAPRIGLEGHVPVVDLGPMRIGQTWKLRAVRLYAGNRPCAWLDDDLGPDAMGWAAAREIPTLLLRVDPREGMTERHFRQLEDFGRGVTDGANPRR
jgi:hypothetical protein